MLSVPSFLLCLTLCVGAGLVIRQRGITEEVDRVAKRFCQQHQVIFLDGTVQCQKMRWNKSPVTQKWRFYRLYVFEFSSDQVERGYGAIVHEGGKVQQINFIDELNIH